ncbi:MAG TPA: DUF4388 domain-containing protein [Nitrospirae bacterium]|nr:DUF4388 domain-containing protein [Nitrospirota bacterium]
MALTGSIKEFGLADILQLIYFQKKTGILKIDGPADNIKIYFHEGNIVAARSAKRPEENRIGNILLKKGILKEEELKALLQRQAETGTRLGSLLIQEDLVSRDVLIDIITHQITDQIVQMFTWKKGTYEFTPQGVPIDKNLGLSLDTQHLLMEGLRIVDEWSIIEGTLTLDTVFEKTDKAEDAELTEEEQEALALVDGENDVSTIIELSGKDDFGISKTLVSLLEKGVIAPVEEAKEVAEEPVKPRKTAAVMTYLIPLFVIVAFAVSFVPAAVKGMPAIKRLNASKTLESLRLSVESYRVKTGFFPESLPSGRVIDPWGNPYVYQRTGDGYRLFSSGPDGKPDTSDDIL